MAALPAFFGLLLAASVTGQTVEITPTEAVRRVGDSLTILCRVAYSIDSCRMTIGQTSYRLSPSIDGDVVYSGQGLTYGECGGIIKKVTEAMNGNISCVLPPASGPIEVSGVMRLLVARAPSDPTLLTPQEPTFREGEVFNAQCIVRDGRPAARISWFLGDEQLLSGVHQAVISSEPGSDLQMISQNITRQLTADDDAKTLVCRSEHEALDQPKEASRQLSIHYPPKGQETGSITIFGLKLGSEGRLNVTVRSNPYPLAEWTVGTQKLVAPQSNDDLTITALEPIALGGGFYNLTLVLSRISKEDVDRTYLLQVHNDVGHAEFSVRISTMDEPAGVELETGAIVGIVIGVLALLIAIFLVVFAKATDRWCFGDHGRGRDNAKSSGESSDTESAVAGREKSKLAGLSSRLRAALPRAKDKVQATEAQAPEAEEKPLSEDKKSVVYAELALGDQTNADKPPPPSTEYAEIVYTDQQQPKENKE